ncbi:MULTISPECIES: glycosyltransferase family 4 protein [unclassified Tenacibaculum]|uniref:glycosyltransferase family 4 protein n=1 Tax=unclassified Tenacibaculum TaxID=2635139 RepID=UPI001F316167|nr:MULTISPECIES: glycosyltransferase family 4 protein [unclassified Tenacibaculum]MCF2874554.1 glycosyltransferase family 4 protein [Tenacibaculum sp. Cn5-1]MCF2934380.1 glycosyltransferase family 4 protein [Tenacibaculum sp. Cn5-34]MCG7510590.1 glycosyltransferase family 4 protein [Tenacibaculum sp. Cn5-46]
MNSDLIVVHTHFHKRRTGVTRSIENVMPNLKRMCQTYLYGYGIEGDKITTKELKNLLFSKKKIVVHCHRNNEVLKMLWYRFLGAKFKLVLTRHAETDPSGLTRFLLKKSDSVVTLTTSMHDKLGIKNTKVSHGVDTDSFIPNEEKRLKDVSQKNIILCAGRVRKAKGQKVLLEAITQELKTHKDWAVVIVGKVDKPEFLEELKELAANVEGQVYFVNETKEIITYYQASKIAVVPSFTEGFSLVCAEAMSCANTTIATKNVGVHSELIEHGKSGYLFESGNVEELRAVLKGLIQNELAYVGEQARKEIEKNWSAKKEANELLAVYNQLYR